jgi:hypothetical protein
MTCKRKRSRRTGGGIRGNLDLGDVAKGDECGVEDLRCHLFIQTTCLIDLEEGKCERVSFLF